LNEAPITAEHLERLFTVRQRAWLNRQFTDFFQIFQFFAFDFSDNLEPSDKRKVKNSEMGYYAASLPSDEGGCPQAFSRILLAQISSCQGTRVVLGLTLPFKGGSHAKAKGV
jgi:hypothetical protein